MSFTPYQFTQICRTIFVPMLRKPVDSNPPCTLFPCLSPDTGSYRTASLKVVRSNENKLSAPLWHSSFFNPILSSNCSKYKRSMNPEMLNQIFEASMSYIEPIASLEVVQNALSTLRNPKFDLNHFSNHVSSIKRRIKIFEAVIYEYL